MPHLHFFESPNAFELFDGNLQLQLFVFKKVNRLIFVLLVIDQKSFEKEQNVLLNF
jgi:hypothetical protein